MAVIFKGMKILENYTLRLLRYPVGSKILTKLLYLACLRIEPNLCFSIFGKNSKTQNGRHFWGEENFFENCQEYID